MTRTQKFVCITLLLPATLLFTGNSTYAQHGGSASSPTPTPPPNMPTPTTTDTAGGTANTNEPVSKEENKAYKQFHNTAPSDADKKTQLAEEFIDKYPNSRYRSEAVSWLATAYLTKGQLDKLAAEGDKEMALNPPNPASLAVIGSNLSRAVTPSTPNAQQHLDQAEQICKKSLDTLATAQKPSDVSEERFKSAKDSASAVAYSGLGTVAFRRAKYTDAISDLDQSIKFGGGSDPVNYYLLGKANEASNNFDQALAAYTKCAATPGGMQAPCQAGATEVKAHGAVLPK
jgi:tetratricopeptide (TPR) repeat protein